MIISFYGEGCFKISTRGGSAKGGQSGEKNILVDPPTASSGLTAPAEGEARQRRPRFKADIMLKTLTPFPITEQMIYPHTTASFGVEVYGPGEYNISDIDIIGIGLIKESSKEFLKTVYLVKMESIRLCFLGHISQMPEPDVLEQLEEIDILFLPAGGKPFIEQKIAAKLIKQIEPKIVIPSFFKVPGLKRHAADLKIFLEETNGHKKEPQEKLIIKKKDLDGIKKTEIAALKV